MSELEFVVFVAIMCLAMFQLLILNAPSKKKHLLIVIALFPLWFVIRSLGAVVQLGVLALVFLFVAGILAWDVGALVGGALLTGVVSGIFLIMDLSEIAEFFSKLCFLFLVLALVRDLLLEGNRV